MSNQGLYLEMALGFGGMIVFVTAKAEAKVGDWGSVSAGVKDKPYTLLEPVEDLLKGRYYIIENKNT